MSNADAERAARNTSANPFTVFSPEGMTAEDAVSLFVDVFTDFPKVREAGHTFLHGPRGSGKSMMFRYLEPDCKRLVRKCGLAELPFYSIYVPLKNTDLKLTELLRLENRHACEILNEHFMIMCIAERTFASLAQNCRDETSHMDATRDFVTRVLALLTDCGWQHAGASGIAEGARCPAEAFQGLQRFFEDQFKQVIRYLKRLAFRTEALPYDGPLCGFLDFLFPALQAAQQLPFMPKTPFYLLIDDADNLNLAQTKILNSWVSSRSSNVVSIKISTQLRYKSYVTLAGHTIDAPHDFYEVNISTVYTTAKRGTYRNRVREIVRKRLQRKGINVRPEDFFPEDTEQEEAIREIAEKYRRDWEQAGRGYRPSDDAVRYARPDYIKSLAGPRKARSSYSYAGFDQLVHVSSGIVRHFLEAAAEMYSDALASGRAVTFIPSGIQDKVAREQANAFLFREFEKRSNDREPLSPDEKALRGLFNLIQALGGLFYEVLVSDRSERRVFSIAFSDDPTREIQDVLDLGVHYGYFHVSSIGKKDGFGRTRLYILSRRLAPFFSLDPTSFAGYLFITTAAISEALETPDRLLRRVKKQGLDEVAEQRQLPLFD